MRNGGWGHVPPLRSGPPPRHAISPSIRRSCARRRPGLSGAHPSCEQQLTGNRSQGASSRIRANPKRKAPGRRHHLSRNGGGRASRPRAVRGRPRGRGRRGRGRAPKPASRTPRHRHALHCARSFVICIARPAESPSNGRKLFHSGNDDHPFHGSHHHRADGPSCCGSSTSIALTQSDTGRHGAGMARRAPDTPRLGAWRGPHGPGTAARNEARAGLAARRSCGRHCRALP